MEKGYTGIYMTFLSEIDIDIPSRINVLRKKGIKAEPTSLVNYLYGDSSYLITSKPMMVKLSYDLTKVELTQKKYYGIRPVIIIKAVKLEKNYEDVINKLILENADTNIENSEVILGSYPTKIVTDKYVIEKLKDLGEYEAASYCIPVGDKLVDCKTIKLFNKKYVYLESEKIYVEVTPLTWLYDNVSHCFICKDVIAGFKTNLEKNNFERMGYDFLNNHLIKDILKDKLIPFKENVNVSCKRFGYDKEELLFFYNPYGGTISVSDEGKIFSFNENNYSINIDENIKIIDKDAIKYIFENCFSQSMTFDINIKGDDKKILSNSFDFTSSSVCTKIRNFNIDGKNLSFDSSAICANSPIENVSIPCDFNLFSLLFSADKTILDTKFMASHEAQNLLYKSNLSLKYENEKELISFLKNIQRFINLFIKDAKNMRAYPNEKIDFTYRHKLYKFDSINEACYDINGQTLFDKIGLLSLTLNGAKIDKEKINNIIGQNVSITYEFTDEVKKEISNEIKSKENAPKLSKEAEHILDLAREIMSIDYIGLDKDDVKAKVDAIIDEYNTSYTVEEQGLSLNSNNMLYTNTILKLENLRDDLYNNFEEKMDYYDILDLISSMIKKLNGEVVKPNYEILKDLDTLVDILKYSKDETTKNEIISYLESEKQNIIDYLCDKKELDYNDINSFIRKFRVYLMPVLTKVSGNVSKIDVLDNIKKYTLNEMNNNSKERVDSCIKMLLSEIDKIKKEILLLDPSYTFNGIDYSSFSSGKEIIDYLENLYKKYYRIYLDLNDKKIKQEEYESNMIPKIY